MCLRARKRGRSVLRAARHRPRLTERKRGALVALSGGATELSSRSSPDPLAVAMKTQMSRFHIHDDLTAPEGSLPVLKGALKSAGQLPNFLGVLAGSPAALRGYARFRSELRHGTLARPDARADRARDRPSLPVQAGHRRAHAHRAAGGARHRRGQPRCRVGLRRRARGRAAALPPAARRGARPRPDASPRGGARGGLDRRAAARGDRDSRELESLTAMVNVAGEVPVDGSLEDTRVLRAA